MRRGWTSDGERSNFSFFSLKMCKCGQSTSLLCQKSSVLFHVLTDNAKFIWVKYISACWMRNWEFEKHRGKTHMGVKKKTHLIFWFFLGRWLQKKKAKRAKLKSFNSMSCRTAGHPPTLRACLMHSLSRCPSCKSCQGVLMCFKTKLCTCSQVNNYFPTTPNLTHGKGQWNDIWALPQSLAYHPGENGFSMCSVGQKNSPGSAWRGKAAKRDTQPWHQHFQRY